MGKIITMALLQPVEGRTGPSVLKVSVGGSNMTLRWAGFLWPLL